MCTLTRSLEAWAQDSRGKAWLSGLDDHWSKLGTNRKHTETCFIKVILEILVHTPKQEEWEAIKPPHGTNVTA